MKTTAATKLKLDMKSGAHLVKNSTQCFLDDNPILDTLNT